MNPSLTRQISQYLDQKDGLAKPELIRSVLKDLGYWECLNLSEVNQDLAQDLFLKDQHFLAGKEFEGALLQKSIRAIRIKSFSFPTETFPLRLGRRLNDIDLWIPQAQEYQKALQIAFEMGYQIYPQTRWEAANNRLNLYKPLIQNRFLFLDLHLNLAWDLNPEHTWDTKKDLRENYLCLEDADLILHLLINWIYQDGLVGLEKLIDLHFLTRNSVSLDADKILKKAQALEILHVAQLGLTLLQEFNNTKIADFQPPQKIEKIAQKIIETDFLINPYQQKIRFFYLKHFVRKNLFQALRYDCLRSISSVSGYFLDSKDSDLFLTP